MTTPDIALTAQIRASDPGVCAFVEANAGSGKTSTLVNRVARLLLAGARPEAILCVTFTKAAAAEMQARLFSTLGDWAVMDDAALGEALAAISEPGRDLSKARALFARALEAPGGLKIQTIHAFCERLLRRFPLEAGLSPAFSVLDDASAAEVSRQARDQTALLALEADASLVGQAYAHLAVELDWDSFNKMLATFESRRGDIEAYVEGCAHGVPPDVWRRCGLEGVTSPEAIEGEAVRRTRWTAWRRAAAALGTSQKDADLELAAALSACGPQSRFAELASVFFLKSGAPKAASRLGLKGTPEEIKTWLLEEQSRLGRTAEQLRAAKIAEDTVHVLILAKAYAAFYEAEKDRLGALDFADLVALSVKLLTVRADAAWVLYKMDGGIEHLLLDEAQDTAPEQWDILRALTEEFFTGRGAGPAGRTVFAVGDEKQSIFSFQGAAPERLAVETQAFAAMALDASLPFQSVKLLESWRSTPEILTFVDAVFAGGPALEGVRPGRGDGVERFPLRHIARRATGGRVDLWPLEVGQPATEVDPWAPVDSDAGKGPARRLAGRVADHIAETLAAGIAVWDKEARRWRACVPGDVLILVRRRNALFHEIIRALKRAGIPVGGPDRLDLAEHGIFQDLLALSRFVLFPDDDLTLAGLLRGPFCDLDETSLFDLAHDRAGALWAALRRRAGERAEWATAAERLSFAVETLPKTAPFDGFSRFLARLDGEGRSMRQRLLTRLGAEGEDALEAFLSLVLSLEGQGYRDLESLAAALARTDLQIKRDPDAPQGQGGGEVRVMTTHGAKGLEAPIVILPDTSTRATSQGSSLLDLPGGGFAWAPRAGADCQVSAAARRLRDEAALQESSRLLYVALTRARDWLIIAGVATEPRYFKGSWRALAEDGFGRLESRATALTGGDEARRFGSDPTPLKREDADIVARVAMPGWIGGLAPPEGPDRRYASPSSLGESDRGEAPSPLTGQGLGRYRRGEIIHGLLERLPDLPRSARASAAARLLARQPELNDDQRAEMAGAALSVLEDPQFASVFGPSSRAEVAVVGAAARLPPGVAISGRIDRLVIEPHRVLIVDFKTNRPAPARIEDADPAYIAQMAAYAAVLAEVYPDRAVEAALVWTDGPRLMAIPETLMRAVLAQVA
jgi:ATP-dependent helicase/nuclease subunit A